jgi:hypothetical protein
MEGNKYIHLRIRRWVAWWFYLGVICGVIAIANILGHQLTGAQDRILLVVGAANWLLGGIVCWAFESIKFESRDTSTPPTVQNPAHQTGETEWHPPSDFLLPGKRQSLLPWRH